MATTGYVDLRGRIKETGDAELKIQHARKKGVAVTTVPVVNFNRLDYGLLEEVGKEYVKQSVRAADTFKDVMHGGGGTRRELMYVAWRLGVC